LHLTFTKISKHAHTYPHFPGVEYFARHTGAATVAAVSTENAFSYSPLVAPPPARTRIPLWERREWCVALVDETLQGWLVS
jgi:hypothetical protein